MQDATAEEKGGPIGATPPNQRPDAKRWTFRKHDLELHRRSSFNRVLLLTCAKLARRGRAQSEGKARQAESERASAEERPCGDGQPRARRDAEGSSAGQRDERRLEPSHGDCLLAHRDVLAQGCELLRS